jgi:enoyl-CoA hydratase/carnithine racemase
MPEPELSEDQRGSARWLVINRPAQRNSLTPALLLLLRDALARAERDPEVRAVCISGAGDKAFCAGADLGTAASGDEGLLAAHELRREYGGLLLDLWRLDKPVVACVNGAALAGGLGLLCACDLAVAADDARFGTPEIDVGLFPYMALAPLRRCVGRRAALELVLTGRKIDAAEALRIGLLNRAVPRAQLDQAVAEVLDSLCSKSPAVLRLGRRAFNITEDMPYEAQLEALAAQLSLNALAEDAMEGVAAFLQKRKPEWKGK